MGVDFYMKGALEPIRTAEGYQATSSNISASASRGIGWFQVTDTQGRLTTLYIPNMLYFQQNNVQEA